MYTPDDEAFYLRIVAVKRRTRGAARNGAGQTGAINGSMEVMEGRPPRLHRWSSLSI